MNILFFNFWFGKKPLILLQVTQEILLVPQTKEELHNSKVKKCAGK